MWVHLLQWEYCRETGGGGKTSPRGSPSLGRGPEGESLYCHYRVRKKPVTLSADAVCCRPRVQTQCAGTGSAVQKAMSPSGVMWQGAHHGSLQQERRRAHSTRASLWDGGTDEQQALPRAWPLSPSTVSPEHAGLPVGCWSHSQGKGVWSMCFVSV